MSKCKPTLKKRPEDVESGEVAVAVFQGNLICQMPTAIGVTCCAPPQPKHERVAMSTQTILIVILLLLLVGALPTWPYSGGWGYYPSGGLGLVLLIVVVLLLMGRL
jgi:Ca2+/Na+ antiporter